MEGRRFWILGLLPVARSRILWGKYLFALLGSFLLLVPLVALSSRMLGSVPQMAWMHVLTALAMCLGLPGIAVGMGALFPNFREETPSKIVSGFGGTVCLVLSVGFVAAMVMGMGFFCRQETLAESEGLQQVVRHPLLLGAAGALALAVLTAVLPMWLGARAINKAEL